MVERNQNKTNGYSVIKCRAKGYQDLITVVGTVPETHVGSVLVEGIGPKFVQRIVKHFGADTLNVIEEDPEQR